MDNAAFHKTAKTRELIQSAGAILLFLPRYSSDLNPIENDFGALKKSGDSIRKNLSTKLSGRIINYSSHYKGDKALAELVQQFDAHANQIKKWKDQLLAGASGGGRRARSADHAAGRCEDASCQDR